MSATPEPPSFMSKAELIRELRTCRHTLDGWIAAGTVPPPWARPGPQSSLWRRADFQEYLATGMWPRECWPTRRD